MPPRCGCVLPFGSPRCMNTFCAIAFGSGSKPRDHVPWIERLNESLDIAQKHMLVDAYERIAYLPRLRVRCGRCDGCNAGTLGRSC